MRCGVFTLSADIFQHTLNLDFLAPISPNHRNASYRRAIDAYRDELAKAAACPEPVPADLKKHLDNICQQMWAAIVYRNNDMMLKIKEISDKDKAELRAVRDKTLEENDTLRCQNDRLQEELYETKTALAEAQKTINSLKEQEIRLTSKLKDVIGGPPPGDPPHGGSPI